MFLLRKETVLGSASDRDVFLAPAACGRLSVYEGSLTNRGRHFSFKKRNKGGESERWKHFDATEVSRGHGEAETFCFFMLQEAGTVEDSRCDEDVCV